MNATLRAAVLDGTLLGLFMLSAGGCAVLLELPASPVQQWLAGAPGLRRCLMGLAMGATAVALIRSPLGQRSGAHMNPATTLAFLRLGRVPGRTAALYVGAQFVLGALGLLAARMLLGPALGAPAVNYVATLPGPHGVLVAFAAEVAMTFVLLTAVLHTSQSRRWNRHTALVAGGLVALYIAVAAPLSGMSLNPARSFASALLARDFTAWWLYLTAPVLGMALAAECFVRRRGAGAVHCAKLHHDNAHACVFRCGWDAA